MNIRHMLLWAALCGAACQVSARQTAVVPLPAQMSAVNGAASLNFKDKMDFGVPAYAGDSLRRLAKDFAGYMKQSFGTGITVRKNATSADIVLTLNPALGAEAYKLDAGSDGRIRIEAARPAGFFYALQTLKQLLPVPGTGKAAVPVVSIADAPRFGWRGFMLDEGRHFYGKEAVKRVLDIMATYKMNRFHWHLTEDQGWRIEIKKYPRLTSVGAWRNTKVLPWGDVKSDGIAYGGYYTQKDIREIVEYARERFIEIVPEIDIPGHSQAAVASYPEWLACDPDQPHGVWEGQGVSTDVINVAKPEAVRFAKDVIAEVTALFPFGYLHLGGDECPTNKWKENAECRALLNRIGSDNFRDLQLDFYRQLQEFMATLPKKQQRRLIFWNEVLHGNTNMLKDPVIMAWIGADRDARVAAERGLDVILSPQIPYYINRRQSKAATEPRSQGSGTETVEAVYSYVPAKGVPESLMPRYLGVQGNFWTEWILDASTVEYLMLPRLAAIAEAGWTPQSSRDFAGFRERILPHGELYRFNGWNYGKHLWEQADK